MKKYQVKADNQVTLSKFDPDDTGNFKKTASDKEKAKALTKSYIEKMGQLQERGTVPRLDQCVDRRATRCGDRRLNGTDQSN